MERYALFLVWKTQQIIHVILPKHIDLMQFLPGFYCRYRQDYSKEKNKEIRSAKEIL